MESSIQRVLPHNIEAEQSILGSILFDKEALLEVVEIIKPNDFYVESHKEIYNAIMDLFGAGKTIDIISVKEQLKIRGTEDLVGGIEYLSNVIDIVPTTANVKVYVNIVKEKSMLRKLIKSSNEIIKMSVQQNDEASSILEQAEKKIFDIAKEKETRGFSHIKDVLIDTFNQIEELYNSKSSFTGVPTGFIDLDFKLSGLQKSDLILVAARPAMGKTAFVLNIAQNVAMSKIPVAFFSLEMSKEQLVNRVLASEAMVNSQKLKTGKLEEEDWLKVAKALGHLSEAPIYIDDTPGLSVMELLAKCRRLKLEKDIGLIIIDYLQLMQGRGRTENRQQEISEISRNLKILAKELNVPVITLSQLSRAPDARADHRPILSDLRESGAIEQDADIVMFLYRDDYYDKESEKKNLTEVIISKHRSGSTGTVDLVWLGEYTKFVNKAKS